MPESPPPTVGARLKDAREKKGISLRDIAARTRISSMSLEALERGDLSRLPGGIFTRAFVRTYAAEVGLDPERTIQDFIAQLPQEAAARTRQPSAVEDGEALESERRAVETAVRLVLVSLPIAGLVVYYGMRSAPQAPRATPAAVVESTADGARGTEPGLERGLTPELSRGSDPVAAAAARPASLTLNITPKGPCWISLTVDRQPSFSGLMNSGEQRQVTAREEILLNIGDAGVFVYTLNGMPGRPLGAPGAVVSRRITLADYKQYLAP
jgi:transcriptional regulator with XRE-family HTH domain